MEQAVEREPQRHEPCLRVQLGGFTAQCPRCEMPDFRVAGQRLACVACGRHCDRATLIQQIACNARLAADVLSERARYFASRAN